MGSWDLNFVQRPDAVTGLQRRVGSYITEFKSNIQERIVREHDFELDDPIPQLNHGTHSEGSAKAYVTGAGDPDPNDRPSGGGQVALALDDNDRGRLLVREERELAFYRNSTDGWIRLELSEIGSISIWPGNTIPTSWRLCNGQSLERDEYVALFNVIGILYGNDTPTSFRVPDFQGLLPMGKGTQDVNSRTKGYTDVLGTIKEDRIQSFTGKVGMNPVYNEGNVVNYADGIFTINSDTGGPKKSRLARSGRGEHANGGFEVDLDNPSVPIRNGEFGHPSVMLTNFIIKVI